MSRVRDTLKNTITEYFYEKYLAKKLWDPLCSLIFSKRPLKWMQTNGKAYLTIGRSHPTVIWLEI